MAVKLSWQFVLTLFCVPCQLFSWACFTHMWCHVEVHWVSVCVVDVGCTQQPTMGSILPRAIQPWKTGNELSQISLWKPTRPNWFLLKFGETTVQGSTHVQKSQMQYYHCHIRRVLCDVKDITCIRGGCMIFWIADIWQEQLIPGSTVPLAMFEYSE